MSEAQWIAEPPILGWQQRFQVSSRLFRTRSAYQQIEVWDTAPFGRTLLLDGVVQTSERDEFIYHEMLAHVPLLAHPNPQRVLIIGGGDGGCLRRVLEHPVREVVQVEIDAAVVEASLKWLPGISGGAYDDPRAQLIIGDGFAFLEETGQAFDVILIDSTDPVGAAIPLFTDRFYKAAARRLRRGGLLVTQSGSPLLMAAELTRVVRLLETIFQRTSVYLANIPSYPAVLWSFTAASQTADPRGASPSRVAQRCAERAIRPSYYTPELQRAAFALPSFLKQSLGEPGPDGIAAPIRSVSRVPTIG